MKLGEIEGGSHGTCPLKDVCHAKACGDPDGCIFANLSDEEAEMEVDEYISKIKTRRVTHA